MTDRERLIEILKLDSCPSPYICDENCKYINLKQCYEERTADLLLEHGVIVPPCKVGQTVYYNDNNYPYKRDILTFESTVSCFDFDFDTGEHIAVLSVLVGGHFFRRTAVKFTDFGKTVFLTYEEAEQALKMSKNNAENP